MNTCSHNTKVDLEAVREEALRLVAGSTVRVTPPALEKLLVETHGLTKQQVKAVIRKLVSGGQLVYTYELGSTFIEPSFNRPVRVSSHVVLKPPGHHFQPEPEDVVIQIKPGVAFGTGRHPTSRLAIRGIEYALKKAKPEWRGQRSRVLDIGTGSGILMLAAVGMGISRGLGIDIDPAARAEARENVGINGLAGRIEISDRYLEAIEGCFHLVTANLRYPTLMGMGSRMRKIIHPKGVLVFSGIRSHELPGFKRSYVRKEFKALWQQEALGWAGLVLVKPGYTRTNTADLDE